MLPNRIISSKYGYTKDKDRENMKNTINQFNTTAIYRMNHPGSAEYTSLSWSHGINTKTDRIFSHKTNLNNFIRIAIIQNMFSDHNEIDLNE